MQTAVATDEIREAPREVRLLLMAGFALFVITVVIGILNGTDLVEFGHDTLLTHVHAGTLGWLTLAIVGGAIWMFGPDDAERLAWATIGAVTIYVIAFWTGDDLFRPVAGTIMFLVVVGIVAWVAARGAGVTRNIPRLAMTLALVSLLFGAVLGILLGLAVTGQADWVPSGIAEAHPPTMVIGYLVLAAIGLVEWLLTGDQADRLRAGQWQVGLVFGAGIVLVLGIIFEVEPLIVANAPLEIVGLGIFLWRVWPWLRQIDWRISSPGRWIGAGVVFLYLDLVLLVYLIGSSQGDFDTVRFDLVLALDHLMFVGALTSVLLAMALVAAPEEGSTAQEVGFYGVTAGLVIFVLGLLGDWVVLKRIGTPILGLALLHIIATAELRLSRAGGVTGAPDLRGR